MQIGDVYKHKKYNKFIQINGFAKHINLLDSDFIIVYDVLQIIDGDIGTCPSSMEYAYSQDQIESNYDLYIKNNDINIENLEKIKQKLNKG